MSEVRVAPVHDLVEISPARPDVAAPPRKDEAATPQLEVGDDVVVYQRRGVITRQRGYRPRDRRVAVNRAAISSTAGRIRLPPPFWMYRPIFGIRSTCDST